MAIVTSPMEMLKAAGRRGSEDVDIARVALALSAIARPDRELGAAEAQLAEIAVAAALLKTADVPALARGLSALLHERLRYDGDRSCYDDLRNADLAAVIQRRRGLPVALGILYIHAARAAGASSHGINFPGHFLVGMGLADGSVLIDPFNGGRIVDGDDLDGLLPKGAKGLARENLQALSDRGTLVRLQNNVVTRAREGGRWPVLASALEGLTLIAPEAAQYRYELGEAYEKTERPMAARAALQAALAQEPGARWAEAARLRLAALTRSLN